MQNVFLPKSGTHTLGLACFYLPIITHSSKKEVHTVCFLTKADLSIHHTSHLNWLFIALSQPWSWRTVSASEHTISSPSPWGSQYALHADKYVYLHHFPARLKSCYLRFAYGKQMAWMHMVSFDKSCKQQQTGIIKHWVSLAVEIVLLQSLTYFCKGFLTWMPGIFMTPKACGVQMLPHQHLEIVFLHTPANFFFTFLVVPVFSDELYQILLRGMYVYSHYSQELNHQHIWFLR